MNFIDHTGHIFSLPSYKAFPVGYEYDEQPYIFWLNESDKLSVKNWYIKPIRFIIPNDIIGTISDYSLEIKLDSQYYKLLGSYHINNLINESKNIFDYFLIGSDTIMYWDGKDYDTICYEDKTNYEEFKLLKDKLTEDDLLVVTNLVDDKNNLYSLVTFYVAAYSDDEHVMLSNILITLKQTLSNIIEYCPITVGAEFIDECESLIINGKNMGINLPKTILRAIYDTSFYNYYTDEVVFNNKIKELLLNYMNIKGQQGNYDSVINSLKWFGWGDKISLYKLIQTDNQFINQYILDKFEITNDILTSYKHFTNTTYIKLQIIGSMESDETNNLNVSKLLNHNDNNIYDTFMGEGLPKIKHLLNNCSYTTYDEGDIKFYKPYYNYLFTELGLKLAALEYYYRKYFLPLHAFIHSSTINYQCFMNDIKLVVKENKTAYNVEPVICYDMESNIKVQFPKEKYIMFYNQVHFVDKNYNEFNKYISVNSSEIDYDLYWVNENCLTIPIKFTQNNNKDIEYYNCQLILEKIEKSVYDYEYILFPDELTNDIYNSYKNEGFPYTLVNYNNINSLSCSRNDKFVNNEILISHQLFTQDNEHQSLVLTNEWDIYRTYSQFKEYIQLNYKDFLLFNQELPYLNIKIKSQQKLDKISVNGINVINDIKYNVIDDTHNIIFKSSFNFTQRKTINNDGSVTYGDTAYRNFVIIPKIINKYKDINFWLNSEFNIYLNVNGYWYNYNFECKVPEFQLELGKLEYKYWLDATNDYITHYSEPNLYKQLNKLTDDSIKFNTFMWQPDLVRVNNVDFFDNLLNYYKDYKYNIKYNNETNELEFNESNNVEQVIYNKNTNTTFNISLNDVFYIIEINNQHIYIHNDVIQEYLINKKHKYILLDTKYLTDENKHSDIYIYNDNDANEIQQYFIYNEHISAEDRKGESPVWYDLKKNEADNSYIYNGSSGSMNIYENIENYLFVGEDGNTFNCTALVTSFTSSNNSDIDLETNIYMSDEVNESNDDYIFVFEDEYIDTKTKYILLYFELYSNEDIDNSIRFYVKTLTGGYKYLNVYQTVYKNEEILYNNYKEFPNIVNNKKYLNKVHLYEIYKNNNSSQFTYDSTENIIDLYNKFFNQDDELSSKINIPYKSDYYDFYLMHDLEKWYALFISKLPVGKQQQGVLDIYDNEKIITHIDYVGKIYKDNGENGYLDINNEILDNIIAKTGLSERDLFVVYNTVDDVYDKSNIEYDMTISIRESVYFKKYLINKVYNKNIGYKQTLNENSANIYWNKDNQYIGVSWITIPIENVTCPKCGQTSYFTYLVHENNRTFAYCKYTYTYTSEPCNYKINVNSNSILYWNDAQIPYKLIYSITDDIYNEETNPNGLLHLKIEDTNDKYMFSMNNTQYYFTKNTGEYYYHLNNIDDTVDGIRQNYEIYSETLKQSYNNCIMDPISYAYYGEIEINDNEFAYLEIIDGLPEEVSYYTYISNVLLYSKDETINKYSKDSNFYILYTGEEIYNGGWGLDISVFSENVNINDIIHIYSLENNQQLQWVVNPDYNYNEFNPYNNTGNILYRINDSENPYYIPCERGDDIINKYMFIKFNCKNSSSDIYISTHIFYDNNDQLSIDNILNNIGIYVYDSNNYIKINIDSNITDDLYVCVQGIYFNIGNYQFIEDNILNENNIYNYLYKLNDTDYIMFNDGKPSINLYLDENGNYFTITQTIIDDNNDNKYRNTKKQIILEYHSNIVNNSDNGTVYNIINKQYYSDNYFNKIDDNIDNIECVICHSNDWLSDNGTRIFDLYGYTENDIKEIDTQYDGLWYFIPTNASLKNKINWEPCIYIDAEILQPNNKWYYNINGTEYPYNRNIQLSNVINSSVYGINVRLPEPIRVELSRIPGYKEEQLYYDKTDYYFFKYVKSDEKFLINRMQFVPNNGKNHYNNDDIIVTAISNKMIKDGVDTNLEFKLEYGSKWLYKPVSLKIENSETLSSNTNMGILSIGDSNIKYNKGYYDIIVNYSIDGNTHNNQKLNARILVK